MRGRLRCCAAISRHAASSRTSASMRRLLLRTLIRRQASAGSRRYVAGSHSTAISSSSQEWRPLLVELRRELLVDVAQMGHVVERVFELAFGERPARPIGEARGFVDLRAGQPAGQRLVARGFAEAAHHGGDLGVEDRRRHLAVEVVEDLEVLARGVEDLEHLGVVHQRGAAERGRCPGPAGRWRRPRRGPADLHQAELRPIGLVAHEFGVDRDVAARLRASGRRRRALRCWRSTGSCRLYTETMPRQKAAPARQPPRLTSRRPPCAVRLDFCTTGNGFGADACLPHPYLRRAAPGRTRARSAAVGLGAPQARPRPAAVHRSARPLRRDAMRDRHRRARSSRRPTR